MVVNERKIKEIRDKLEKIKSYKKYSENLKEIIK